MVRSEMHLPVFNIRDIVCFASLHAGVGKSGAEFNTLYGTDPHESTGEV